MKYHRRTKKKRRGGGSGGWLDSIVGSVLGSGSKTKKLNKPEKMICNPAAIKDAAHPTTCYSEKNLLKIRDAYNANHSDKPIDTNIPAKELIHELKKRLSSKCPKEDCWLNLLPKAQREILDKEVFAPDQPKEWDSNPDEWLSNFDILNVLEQYEKAYPKFEFLGPTPIDFDTVKNGKCIWEEICHFQISKYQEKGVTEIAFIFNLDKHNQSGSHWTSMYLSLKHNKLFYFDSALNDMPKEVQVLVDRITKQASDLGINLHFEKNVRQHQRGNSECGMYSLFFILTLLTGKCGGLDRPIDFHRAIKMFKCKHIPDKMVFAFRDRYYNDP